MQQPEGILQDNDGLLAAGMGHMCAAINSLTSMMEGKRQADEGGRGGAYSRHVQQATNDALLIDDPGNNHEEARN